MAALVRSDLTIRGTEWVETTATIISSDYQYSKPKDIDLEDPFSDRSYFLVTFSYSVNGELYLDKFESSSSYEPGQSIDISFNPSNPLENCWSKERPTTIRRVTLWTVGIVFLLILVYLARRFGWQE